MTGGVKDPAHTGTSRGVSQAISRRPIRKFLTKYANVYVTIQSHALSAGPQSHYEIANGVRNGLVGSVYMYSLSMPHWVLALPRTTESTVYAHAWTLVRGKDRLQIPPSI